MPPPIFLLWSTCKFAGHATSGSGLAELPAAKAGYSTRRLLPCISISYSLRLVFGEVESAVLFLAAGDRLQAC
jgi:hypothetical protein